MLAYRWRVGGRETTATTDMTLQRKATMTDPAPAEVLYGTLVKLFLVVDNSDRCVLARHGLTLPRFHVLQHLHNEPDISFARLSALMLTDRANVSRIVRGMEADGLVSRRLNEQDRRSYLLQLTGRGADLYAQASATHRADIALRFRDAGDGSGRRLFPDLLGQLGVLCDQLEQHLEMLRQPTG
jgi:DNA-binding MarR family transcriptional regulator